jgi:hypothetical protein
MEAIWQDLSHHVESLNIPKEHREILDDRRNQVTSGNAVLHDWDTVKHTIGRK